VAWVVDRAEAEVAWAAQGEVRIRGDGAVEVERRVVVIVAHADRQVDRSGVGLHRAAGLRNDAVAGGQVDVPGGALNGDAAVDRDVVVGRRQLPGRNGFAGRLRRRRSDGAAAGGVDGKGHRTAGRQRRQAVGEVADLVAGCAVKLVHRSDGH